LREKIIIITKERDQLQIDISALLKKIKELEEQLKEIEV